MFTVQYRCRYREFWYDAPGGDGVDWVTAVAMAQALMAIGRAVRIVDYSVGVPVWQSQ
jgi:hypothetical protein